MVAAVRLGRRLPRVVEGVTALLEGVAAVPRVGAARLPVPGRVLLEHRPAIVVEEEAACAELRRVRAVRPVPEGVDITKLATLLVREGARVRRPLEPERAAERLRVGEERAAREEHRVGRRALEVHHRAEGGLGGHVRLEGGAARLVGVEQVGVAVADAAVRHVHRARAARAPRDDRRRVGVLVLERRRRLVVVRVPLRIDLVEFLVAQRPVARRPLVARALRREQDVALEEAAAVGAAVGAPLCRQHADHPCPAELHLTARRHVVAVAIEERPRRRATRAADVHARERRVAGGAGGDAGGGGRVGKPVDE